MKSLKQTSIKVIHGLPETSTLEDIMYEINLTAQVLEGLENEKKGKTITTSELLKRIEKWHQKRK